MTPFEAVAIAEGWGGNDEEDHDEAKVLEAWQTLVDTGLCWQLQGWFGRTAQALIEAGQIERR